MYCPTGERLDFVLKANRGIRSYGLIVRTVKECLSPPVVGAAILRYKGAPDEEPSVIQGTDIVQVIEGDQQDPKDVDLTSNLSSDCESRNKICITDINGKRKMPEILREVPDVTIYLPINYSIEKTEFTGEE